MRKSPLSLHRALILLGAMITVLAYTIISLSFAPLNFAVGKSQKRDEALRAAGRGNPAINLQDGYGLEQTYEGDALLAQALEKDQAAPLSIASADFDEDGAPDLVTGYRHAAAGILTLCRGNIDSIYPNSPEAQKRKAESRFIDSAFLPHARAVSLPAPPDFLSAGDFDADGHWDVVSAQAGANALFLLAGDGRGGFLPARRIQLRGSVTVMVAGEINRADGLTDLAVSINAGDGPKALVFEGPEGALRAEPEEIQLPAEARAMAMGQMDDAYPMDLAVGAGSEAIIIHGRDRKLSLNEAARRDVSRPLVSRHYFPFAIESIALGEFTGSSRFEAAVLSSEGELHVMRWRAEKQVWESEPLISDRLSASARLLRANVSTSTTDDLLVIDNASRQLQIVIGSHESAPASSPRIAASLDVEGDPVAVMPMRLNNDALSDLVILRTGHSAPSVAETAPVSTFAVTNTSDSGSGSLRQAILDANANSGADMISFQIGSGAQTISLSSALPIVTGAVTIDATTQTGFAGSPLIELDGSGAGNVNGFFITAGSSTVKGFVINRFGDSGIRLQSGGNNFIEGNYTGVDAAGNSASANTIGIFVDGSNNTIGGTTAAARNIVSGNSLRGILISGSGTGNFVRGNYIGINASGSAGVGGLASPGLVINGGSGNTLGGTTAGARNVVSANDEGIRIDGTSATGHLVQGNYVGTNAAGTSALPNAQMGVFLFQGNSHTVGGTTTAARNVISGNTTSSTHGGVEIFASNQNLVQGNFIGTQANGTSALGNNSHGVFLTGFSIFGFASNNSIGGSVSGAANLIAFNGAAGVFVNTGTGNSISGNSIFSNAGPGINLAPTGVTANDSGDGDTGSNNLQNFPVLTSAASGPGTTVVGSLNSTANTTFTIEFFYNSACDGSNNGEGQTLFGSTTILTDGGGNANINFTAFATVISGRFITATATDPANNTSEFSSCVQVTSATGFFVVTSTGDAGDNNLGDGICNDGSGNCTLRAAIQQSNATAGANTIAFEIGGGGAQTIAPTSALPSVNETTLIDGTTQPGFAGKPIIELNGAGAGAGVNGLLIIAANSAVRGLVINRFSQRGIQLAFGSNMLIEGNYIGTDLTGTIRRDNGLGGLFVSADNTTIGGLSVAARNIISGNTGSGIVINPGAGSIVRGNYIGTDVTGANALGNSGSGIDITNAPNTIIGGTTAGARNIICANGSNGIMITSNCSGTQVQGNLIGTDVTGTLDRGNSAAGININNAPGNVIGGTTAAARNVISGNGSHGIQIGGASATGNTVQGNIIGLAANGINELGNGNNGLLVAAQNNVIGGTTGGAGNLISDNGRHGIEITSTGTQVQGNIIGTDSSGTLDRGNSMDGVFINPGSNNTIGGTVVAARNLISGNNRNGVEIMGGTSTGNLVQGNFIGTDVTGTLDLGNNGSGVGIIGSPGNTIGGTAAGAGNLISGNNEQGIGLVGIGQNNAIQGNFIGTDVTGTLDLGNTINGILITAPNNTIGGTVAAARNVISGNNQNGIEFLPGGTGILVQGNFIGTKADGASPLPNSMNGVHVNGVAAMSNNTIGGTAAGAGNVIAFNGEDGVFVRAGGVVRILSNSIFSNTGLGIDLSPDGTTRGVTPNDAGDADLGANTLQNFPVITSSLTTTVTVTGSLNSNANTTFRLEFFSQPGCDGSGNGEGQTFLGTMNVTTDATGNVSFIIPFAGSVPAGHVVTATATDPAGNTSEFSACKQNFSGTFVVNSTGDAGDNNLSDMACNDGTGFCTLRAALQQANAFAGVNRINFSIGTGAQTITPSSPLPAITDPVIIDGKTQPGFTSTPIIELNGTNAGAGAIGVVVNAGNSTVQGLVINRFGGGGIQTNTSGNNTIQCNYVGTNVAGTGALGNGGDGISISGSNNTIGGSAPGAGNIIAFNGDSGVQILTGTGNLIRSDSIHSNGGLGINLGADGVTPNDPMDADSGPNNLQNFPVLSSAINNGSSTTVRGTLNSAANTQFVVEFFSNTSCDSSMHGEGATPLGSTTVMTDGNGIAAIEATLATAVPVGQLITAIATDPGNNSSEFSACLQVCPSITLAPLALPSGTVGTAYNQTITASGGTPPYNFAVSVGGLPTGLTLSSGGALAGTPTAPGSFTFTVTATDSGGCKGSRSYTVTVSQASPCAAPSFAAAVNYGAVAGPIRVAMGNFNSDSALDLAVANRDSSVVSIFLNTGTGSFAAAANFAAGSSPTAVAVGDFNNDNNLDLAVSIFDSANVSILLGTGTGTFGAPTNFGVGTNPLAVAVGDFNSDGEADIAVVNSTSNNVSILLGTGTGSFAAAINVAVGASPSGVAVADFNSDGKADLAVSSFDNSNVSILLGTGTGSFGPLSSFIVGFNPISIATGDFNNDSKGDLATTNYTSSNVSVLLGDGVGSFGAATNFAVGANPSYVAVGDVNGDGINDLAVSVESLNKVSILPGTGTGSFGPPTGFDTGTVPQGIAVGDLSGDGKLDLAVTNFVSTNVSVLLNNCCTASFPIFPTSQFFSGAGGEGSIKVTAPSNCSWTATSNASWITITSDATGMGPDAVTYLVRDNFDPLPRTGTITVAGQTFNITQNRKNAPVCSFTLSPSFIVFGASGGASIINVSAGASCAWQSTSDVPWITITSNCCGIGNGAITYTVEPNATGTGRNGVITIAGKKFNVKQTAN